MGHHQGSCLMIFWANPIDCLAFRFFCGVPWVPWTNAPNSGMKHYVEGYLKGYIYIYIHCIYIYNIYIYICITCNPEWATCNEASVPQHNSSLWCWYHQSPSGVPFQPPRVLPRFIVFRLRWIRRCRKSWVWRLPGYLRPCCSGCRSSQTDPQWMGAYPIVTPRFCGIISVIYHVCREEHCMQCPLII